jgi:hypothetical protein
VIDRSGTFDGDGRSEMRGVAAEVHAEVSVDGDVVGQIAIGNNILQIDPSPAIWSWPQRVGSCERSRTSGTRWSQLAQRRPTPVLK